MHKMSSAMNKKSTLNPNPETILKARDPVNLRTNKAENVTVIDIEKENRLSRIISLYSKGFTQSEIAQKLDVDQSTISRDLQFIKQEAKRTIEKYLNEDILFEYLRYLQVLMK